MDRQASPGTGPTVRSSLSIDRSGRSTRRPFVSARSSVSSVRSSRRLLGEHPRERPADLLGQVGANVAGHLLVRRNARLRAEELLVHHLPRQARRSLAEQPDQRSVEVAVAALHTELAVARRAGTRRDRTPPSAPTRRASRVRPGTGRVAGQWRDRVREHLADVGPRVDREPLGQSGVGDVVTIAHSSPQTLCTWRGIVACNGDDRRRRDAATGDTGDTVSRRHDWGAFSRTAPGCSTATALQWYPVAGLLRQAASAGVPALTRPTRMPPGCGSSPSPVA